jgi:membrane dipeptidase
MTPSTAEHRTTSIFEGHSDLMIDVAHRRLRGEVGALEQIHLPRLREGGVGTQVIAVGGDAQMFAGDADANATVEALRVIEMLWDEVDASAGSMRVVSSSDDLANGGSLELVLHLEGGRPFAGNVDLVRCLVRLGVRSVGLTWNHANELADGSLEPRQGGLTEFGTQVVRELMRLGVVVDVSHASDRAVWDVLAVADGPIIASHSNARALCDHPRNLPDDLLRAIAQTGGTVGVVFYPTFVTARSDAAPSLRDVVGHISYLCDVCGPDHVAIGPDFIDMLPGAWIDSAAHAAIRTDLRRPFPVGLENVEQLPALREGLIAAGFDDRTVAGVMGDNLRRVYRTCLAPARGVHTLTMPAHQLISSASGGNDD